MRGVRGRLSEWIRERRRDQYYKKAKENGYASRASYKLLQLDRKHRIFRKGYKVLDIGSAPGGWSQVARNLVGGSGLVVGVDLVEMPPPRFENMIFLVGDIFDESTFQAIRSVGTEFDVIISDASPTISGIWTRDHLLSIDLVRRALELCVLLLRDGGNFVAKVFQGEELKALEMTIKSEFGFVKRSKPEASRGQSSEIYIVAKGFSGRTSEKTDGPQ